MALRGVGVQTITTTNVGQPLFGTTVTNAFQVTPDQFAGNTGAGANPSIASLVVASTAVFRVGDKVMIGTAAASFIAVPTLAPDFGEVVSISSATAMKVKGLTRSHAATEFIVMCTTCSYLAIQPQGSTAVMYIGEDSTVAAGSATLIEVIPVASVTSQPVFQLGASSNGNVYETSHLWITGTTAQTYLPILNKI